MTLRPSPLGRSSSPPSSSTPAPSVIVHTVNVVRNIKPSQGGQVADAVHQTLHFALDGLEDDWAQPDDSEEEQRTPCGGGGAASSSSAPASTLTSASGIPIRRGFVPNPVTSQSQDRPYISYEYNSALHTLLLPHSAAIPDPLEIDPCGPQGREAHDVTAKMHLPALDGDGDVDEGKLVEEALQQLRQNTGLLTVDTLILAFEGLSAEGSGDAALQRDVERVRRVWQSLSPSPYIQSLGLADVPTSFLEALFPRSVQPSPPRVPSAYRLPRVIALRSSPPADKEEAKKLTAWGQAWEETVGEALPSILSHSDPPTILPRQALRSLLGEFSTRLPFPQQSQGVVWAQRAEPKWCLRVTVINRDRGLVSGKSYLVKAGAPRSSST